MKRLYFDRLEKLVSNKTDTGISYKLHQLCNSIAPSYDSASNVIT